MRRPCPLPSVRGIVVHYRYRNPCRRRLQLRLDHVDAPANEAPFCGWLGDVASDPLGASTNIGQHLVETPAMKFIAMRIPVRQSGRWPKSDRLGIAAQL